VGPADEGASGSGRAATAIDPDRAGSAPPPDTLPMCLGDLDGLRAKRRGLDEQLARTSGPHSMYLAGSDNPVAAAVLRPLLEAHIHDDRGAAVPFDLECHDLACRTESLWPQGRGSTFPGVRNVGDDLGARTGPWQMSMGGSVRDTLTGETLEKVIAYVGLRRQDGGPAPRATLERSLDWIPVRNPEPPVGDLTSCRADLRELERAISHENLIMEAGRDPGEPPAGSSPDPALTARLRPMLTETLTTSVGATTLAVSCYELDCRLEVPAEFARRHPDWLRDMHGPRFDEAAARGTYIVGEPIGYVRLLPPGFQRGSVWLRETVDRRADSAARARAIAGCRPGAAVVGTVGVILAVTTGRLADERGDDAPIHFSQTGSLAGTSAADCVMAIYRQLLADVEVPATLWEGTTTFEHTWSD
jgi:hypothetical protein